MMMKCQTWPEPVIRVQALADSRLTTIPKRYISQIPTTTATILHGHDASFSHDDVKIPVTDLGGDPEETVRRVGEACREGGFFQGVNHGVRHDLMRSARAVWREFFNKTAEAKEEFANSPATYEGYGSRLGVQKGAVLDWSDCFLLHFMPASLRNKSKWPSIPPSLSAYNWIIVGWALMMLSLGLVTVGFPCIDVQERDLNKALITYITMLILELGIWIPLCMYISPPPEGHMKSTKLVLRASFVIFNQLSNISEQIISSIHYLNDGRSVTFINIFCGAVGFLIISALFWLTIDVKRRFCVKWEFLPLGCNAVLSATLLNISVFQLIVKKSFLNFPLFAILRDVIDLVDFIIKIAHNKETA